MRKKALVIILILLFFISNVTFTKGGYHVATGNIFQYKMEKIQVDVKLDGTEYSGNGYTLSGNHVDQGTFATIIVDSNSGTSVGYTHYSGGFDQTFTAEWVLEDELKIQSEILSVLWHSQPYLTNPSLLTNLNMLIFYPFVDAALVEDKFEEFVDGTNYQLTNLLPNLNSPTFQAISETSGDIYTFESLLTGNTEASGGSPEYDFDFKLQNKFVYDGNLGVLQGMHYLATGKGTFNDQKAEFSVESLIYLSSYTMPGFTLGGFNFDISEDWWIIAAGGGGLLLIIIIVIIVTIVGKKKKPTKKKTSKKRK